MLPKEVTATAGGEEGQRSATEAPDNSSWPSRAKITLLQAEAVQGKKIIKFVGEQLRRKAGKSAGAK
ncbi:MAG: hypothetical protein ACLU5I_02755 [Alistipes finegoldii]